MKINNTILLSVKSPVRKYILSYTFIHKSMNNRQIYQANVRPGSSPCSYFRTHGVVKVPLTFVKIVVHENKYHHCVKHETSCKKIHILLHTYSQFIEPGLAEDLCCVCGWVLSETECWVMCVREFEIDPAVELFNQETWNIQER